MAEEMLSTMLVMFTGGAAFSAAIVLSFVGTPVVVVCEGGSAVRERFDPT